MTRFTWLDYSIFFGYLAAAVGLGACFVKGAAGVAGFGTTISFMWLGVVGCVVTWIVGWSASLVFPLRGKAVEQETMEKTEA